MFLETITITDWDCLVPINRIKRITTSYCGDSYKISIFTIDGDDFVECFRKEENFHARYKEIKEIIKAE